MMITIYPKNQNESKERHPNLHGIPVINPQTGKPYEDGKYFMNKEHTVIVCFYNGYIDGRGNKGVVPGSSGWAIQHSDGHTEFWKNGVPHREEGPAIVSMYGSWEEYWTNGKVEKIIQDDYIFDEVTKE